MKRLPTVVLCLVLLLTLGDVSARSLQTAPASGGNVAARARFVGTWKLLYRDTPSKVGADAIRTVETGRLTYDERGNITVQVARQGRDTPLERGSDPIVCSSFEAASESPTAFSARALLICQ
jgi:hypothetical protein